MNHYNRVPFIISQKQYFIDMDCEYYLLETSKIKSKKIGDIDIEYCTLKCNVDRYNEMGIKLFSCRDCKKEEHKNGIQKYDGDDFGKELSELSGSEDPVADFFRAVE